MGEKYERSLKLRNQRQRAYYHQKKLQTQLLAHDLNLTSTSISASDFDSTEPTTMQSTSPIKQQTSHLPSIEIVVPGMSGSAVFVDPAAPNNPATGGGSSSDGIQLLHVDTDALHAEDDDYDLPVRDDQFITFTPTQLNQLVKSIKQQVAQEVKMELRHLLRVGHKEAKACREDVKALRQEIHTVLDMIRDRENLVEERQVYSLDVMQRECDFSLPIRNEEEFQKLEDIISNNVEGIRDKLIGYFVGIVDPLKDAVDSIRLIFKDRFFKRDAIVNFVAQRAAPGKKAFNATHFYLCLEDALTQVYNMELKRNQKSKDDDRISEETFIKRKMQLMSNLKVAKAVGVVLASVKDWEGYRVKRKKSNPE